jgi:hypothetical protein
MKDHRRERERKKDKMTEKMWNLLFELEHLDVQITSKIGQFKLD